MEAPRPDPLTPADCDLTDFKFMPLLVNRLRDSELASEQTPEENWAAVLLWAHSWHQVPAASLPDVDSTIAGWAGYKMRGKVDARWKDIRKGAMRGFVLCSDGRWYHPTVAEVARDAWMGKLKQRLKTECNRIKKHNERHGTRVPFPDFDTWLAAGCPTGQPLPVPGDKTPMSPGQDDMSPRQPPFVTGETPSKGQGEGQGEGEGQGQGFLIPPPTGVRDPADAEHPPNSAMGMNGRATNGHHPGHGDGHAADIPDCPHEEIRRLWRELVPNLPQPEKWTDKRATHLRARWRELFAEGKVRNREEALQWFAKYFRWIGQSKFLTGRSIPRPGRPPFEARLDWVLVPDNMAKVIEGEYHREE